MITIFEWLKKNNVHKSIIEKGRAVVAVNVQENENPDTMVRDQNTGEFVFMKKISNLDQKVDEEKTRVFVIGTEQWKKMTKQNLFMSKLRQIPEVTDE